MIIIDGADVSGVDIKSLIENSVDDKNINDNNNLKDLFEYCLKRQGRYLRTGCSCVAVYCSTELVVGLTRAI